MSFNLSSLVRENILNLKPYSSARDEFDGAAEIFLDANENHQDFVLGKGYNRYPDPYQSEFKKELAKIKGVDPAQIFVGNGSDEAIDLLFRIFCYPEKDNVITLPPTYGMYQVSADINGVETVKVSLTADYNIDVAAILKAVNENTKIIFICSPNNPTGNQIPEEDIKKILTSFSGIVVVDEAYIDFSSRPSFTTFLNQYPNLLVMQTFSKAWGLAALRLGLAYASPEIITLLNKVKPPYNINAYTQEAGLLALSKKEEMEQRVQDILREKEILIKEIKALPTVNQIYPSEANFILVKIEKANELYQFLIDSKVIVRNRSSVQLCESSLRITIGNTAENQALISAIKKFK